MSFPRISPKEAHDLVANEGYVLVDVRSVPEFTESHPEGAYNVPLNHMGAGGMTPNADFLRVMEATFPKDTKIVVACKAGGRSMKAAQQLTAAGYTNIVDQRAGFSGAADPFGKLEPGWGPAGLPVSKTASEGRTYAELESKK
jgi:rhodanese-related sulfurtransferase